MPDTPPPAYDPEAILQVKRDATAQLLAIPNVVAVGIGPKVIGDEPTGEPAIKVFVREKLPPEQVASEELIPPRIDGVVTDVEIGCDPVPHTADPTDAAGWIGAGGRENPDVMTYRPLVGGCMITPVGSDWRGTGGCLVRDKANPNVVYMLTNYHVVSPPDLPEAVVNDTIGQPLGDDRRAFYDVIGMFAGGGRNDDRDEALVRLTPGMKWQARIADIGMVAGKYTVTLADLTKPGGALYRVAKRGATSKLTGGWITAIRVSTENSARDNLMTIQGNPNDGAIKNVRFGVGGDSGSVVVNDAKQVVGLYWGGWEADPLGYAFHIDHVLERLRDIDHIDVEVATTTDPNEVHIVPGQGTLMEEPPEVAERVAADPAERRAFTGTGNAAPVGRPSDVAPGPRTVAGVRDDLAGCAAGRALIELWDAYGEELRALIGRNRRVTIAWYRGGGAALMQLMLRLPADPSRTLPETLSGVPLMTCVDRLADAFAREGSAGLGDGIRKARALLPDLAGLTYAEIIAALRAKELIPDG